MKNSKHRRVIPSTDLSAEKGDKGILLMVQGPLWKMDMEKAKVLQSTFLFFIFFSPWWDLPSWIPDQRQNPKQARINLNGKGLGD